MTLFLRSAIRSVTLDVPDPMAASTFTSAAFGLHDQVRFRAADAATAGFGGFVLSLVVAQPCTVSSLIDTAVEAGAATLKPAAESLFGYGGVVRAPDGTVWKIATAAKDDSGQATRRIDQLVLLLGAEDVAASRHFYLNRGFGVAKSFGSSYVEFAAPLSPVKLALYRRPSLAEDAGVTLDDTRSHRLSIGSTAGAFTDPDGFAWEPASTRVRPTTPLAAPALP